MVEQFYKTPRKKMRLEGFDYSNKGAFFVTLCTHNRELLFSNESAKILIKKYWEKLAEKYEIELDDYVVMPNHLHGIIHIVGADPCVGPSCLPANELLPRAIKWFKTLTTNAYLEGIKNNGWQPFIGKLWQRSYHERVIRDFKELNSFKVYIQENPARWDDDQDNPAFKAS